MSIATELQNYNDGLLDAYDAVDTKGGTIPTNKNLDNLPTAIGSIPAGGGGGPLDPQEVYRTERPAEWYPMPSVSDNEIYCLIEIPKPNQAKDPGVKIEFTGEATAWKVEAGIVADGSFVPNPDYTESYTGRKTYSATFYYNDFSSNPLSDGSHQVMLHIVATSGNFSSFGNPVGMDNIIETRLHVESMSNTSGLPFRGKKMKFFSMEGGNRITSFQSMFSSCSSLTTIPQLNTSSGTNFGYMFYNCSSLTAIPQLNTSSGTNFSSMFYNCSSLTAIPQLNTSSGTNFGYMFYNCSSLTAIPQLDTSSGTSFQSMFQKCYSLTAIPQLNTSSGTNFSSMFYDCSSLTAIPQLDTSSGTNFSSMFNACRSLTAIPQLNTSSGTNFSSMFQGCTSLRYVNFVGYDFTGITDGNNRPNNTSITRDGVARIDNKFQMSTGGFTGSIFSPSDLASSRPAYILVEDNGTMIPLGTSAATVFGSNQYLYVVVSDSMYNTYMADTNWSALGARLKKASEVTLPDWYTRV